MAYLSPEYKHDIFFSYPHADADHSGASDLKAWSQRFADDLRNSLISSKKHEGLSFFLDQGGRGGERLDEATTPSRALDEAANAAVLIALMSPWYLASAWCKAEREAWIKGIGGDAGRIAQQFDRAFVMRVQDTGDDLWPSEFTDAQKNENLGFWLYVRALGEAAMPFGWIGDDEDKGKYRRMLLQVRQALLIRLGQLHARLKEERDKRDTLLGLLGRRERFTTVYVHARPSAKAAFDQTCDQLVSTQFLPIPARPEPLRPDGRLTDREKERLQTADALLVVGTEEEDLLMDIVVVGRHALDLATAETPKLLPGAVLDKIGTPSARYALRPRASIASLYWLDGGDPGWTASSA